MFDSGLEPVVGSSMTPRNSLNHVPGNIGTTEYKYTNMEDSVPIFCGWIRSWSCCSSY